MNSGGFWRVAMESDVKDRDAERLLYHLTYLEIRHMKILCGREFISVPVVRYTIMTT